MAKNIILVKITNYSHFYIGKWTVVILEACNYAKNDPETINVVSRCY